MSTTTSPNPTRETFRRCPTSSVYTRNTLQSTCAPNVLHGSRTTGPLHWQTGTNERPKRRTPAAAARSATHTPTRSSPSPRHRPRAWGTRSPPQRILRSFALGHEPYPRGRTRITTRIRSLGSVRLAFVRRWLQCRSETLAPLSGGPGGWQSAVDPSLAQQSDTDASRSRPRPALHLVVPRARWSTIHWWPVSTPRACPREHRCVPLHTLHRVVLLHTPQRSAHRG